MDTVIMRLDNGDATLLAEYLTEEIERSVYSADLLVSLAPAETRHGGFQLPIGAEIVIAGAKGLAGGIGAGAGKFIWDRIRKYLRNRKAAEVVIVAPSGRESRFSSDSLPDEPPFVNPS